MFIIGNKLVSEDLFDVKFACDLNACKGACCWEGDYGAPLEEEELSILDRIYEDVKPFLRPEGIKVIEEQGAYEYVEEGKEYATTLVDNAACSFLTFDKNGVAMCGIEKAYFEGATDFRKPISCHLYPIRTEKLLDYESLNYDEWSICSAACEKGKRLEVTIYEFAKDALIRRYGALFYEELDAIGQAYIQEKKQR